MLPAAGDARGDKHEIVFKSLYRKGETSVIGLLGEAFLYKVGGAKVAVSLFLLLFTSVSSKRVEVLLRYLGNCCYLEVDKKRANLLFWPSGRGIRQFFSFFSLTLLRAAG